ncbi:DUF2892 domain-containing protein [Bdellovibrionales bacterium]|nr:DUF2892 domain-containing protein [Bdellovibrionales bacterium]
MKNIVLWDRALRFLIGVTLFSWAIAGGPTWSYFGLYLLATGAWGFSPIYWSVPINFKRQPRK